MFKRRRFVKFSPVHFTGLGGAFGYLVGAMDWGHSLLGKLLGSEYQVIYFFSALTWGIFLSVHLFSIQEEPLCKASSNTDASATSALRPLSSHSNGYGTLSKEPVASVARGSMPDIRPRSFSALGEANSVTSSAKQPNKEVCDEAGGTTEPNQVNRTRIFIVDSP